MRELIRTRKVSDKLQATNKGMDGIDGTHWSMLLWYADQKTFIHCDPKKACNEESAREFAKVYARYEEVTEYEYREVTVPQQTNCKQSCIYLLNTH